MAADEERVATGVDKEGSVTLTMGKVKPFNGDLDNS
jgi:hypothetical protein